MKRTFIFLGIFSAVIFGAGRFVWAHGHHPPTRDLRQHVAYHLDEIHRKKGKTDFDGRDSQGVSVLSDFSWNR